jgi:hypothetical protein
MNPVPASSAPSSRRQFFRQLAVGAAVLGLGLSVACSAIAPRGKSIVAPPPAAIAALMSFNGPVTLTLERIAPEQWAHGYRGETPQISGDALAAFSYEDKSSSDHSFIVAILKAGTFFGAERARMFALIDDTHPKLKAAMVAAKLSDQPKDSDLPYATNPASGGRIIRTFVLGVGPGGSTAGALLSCTDPRYELLLIENVDGHEDRPPPAVPYAKPEKRLWAVMEHIERLVFQ